MASPDPVAHRFVPDPALVHRAHNLLLDDEKDRPVKKYIRQQWDAAFGATRVGMDALREVWPMEARHMPADVQTFLADALDSLENAYHALDSVAEEMVGPLMVAVQQGEIRTMQDFDAYLDAADDTDQA